MNNVKLLIIDPQFDFCDPQGTLYVPGAELDTHRLSQMIQKHLGEIDQIHLSLDQHHLGHIAHPIFWMDPAGHRPAPFTQIRSEDLRAGHWLPRNPELYEQTLAYVQNLETNARYQLIIWPPHCLIGSRGASVMPELFDALFQWENRFNHVNKIVKGLNCMTEHYSALRADVIDPDDPGTWLNQNLIEELNRNPQQQILIAGQALSHCIANTVRDLAETLGDQQIKNLVLLEDACSPVPGFEHLAIDFVQDLCARGMQVASTETFFG